MFDETRPDLPSTNERDLASDALIQIWYIIKRMCRKEQARQGVIQLARLRSGRKPARPRGMPINAPDAGRSPTRAVTFSKDVAPILLEHCATCHRPPTPAGNLGSMVFAGAFQLIEYRDVREHAKQVADATASASCAMAAGQGATIVRERAPAANDDRDHQTLG